MAAEAKNNDDLKELIGDKFLKKDGNTTSYDESIKGNDLIGIYFSAHWCGVEYI